jgi:predicted alpha/beta hydrolase family esterase
MAARVLTLPGWQNSGPAHWQSRWEQMHGHTRVEQHDWMLPKRGDWIARLDDVVSRSTQPVVLVAHSLGCQLVAAWATLSPSTDRVQAAFLVAPGDVETVPQLQSVLPTWSPIVRKKLPFQALLIGSRNDPYCSFSRAQEMAQDWGAHFVDQGAQGHINAESGLGDWPQGHNLLRELVAQTSKENIDQETQREKS